MEEQGGAAGMEEPSPQSSSKGPRGRRQQGGKPPEAQPAGPAPVDEESGGQGAPADNDPAEDAARKTEEIESGASAQQMGTPTEKPEPQSKPPSHLLRFERRGHRRRR
jgi:hypothetical protein